MIEAKVIKPHVAEYPNPLKLTRGQKVDLKEHSAEWPGWIYAKIEDGNAGWIHESYLDIKGAQGTVGRDYDATELTVNAGEILKILDRKSGWCLCQRDSGEIGWVPERNLSVNS